MVSLPRPSQETVRHMHETRSPIESNIYWNMWWILSCFLPCLCRGFAQDPYLPGREVKMPCDLCSDCHVTQNALHFTNWSSKPEQRFRSFSCEEATTFRQFDVMSFHSVSWWGILPGAPERPWRTSPKRFLWSNWWNRKSLSDVSPSGWGISDYGFERSM